MTGHPTLEDLDIRQGNDGDFMASEADCVELGTALAALISADVPSLRRVTMHEMSESVIRLAVRALDRNTHLQEFVIWTVTSGSADLVCEARDAGARMELRTGEKDVLRWTWDEAE